MKEYKYWFYYLKDDKTLYAYTDQKELARKFESTRDMNIFYKIKKVISKDALNSLAEEYQNKYLNEYELNTYDTNTGYKCKVYIVMTQEEYMTVLASDAGILVGLNSHCFYDPRIFKDEIQEALNEIYYKYFFTSISSGKAILYEFDENVNLTIDQLGVFLAFYGLYMKK